MDVLRLIEEEGKRRNLSLKTIEAYCFCSNKFLKWVNKDPKKIRKDDIKEFMLYLVNKGKSGSTLNVYLNSLKFMLEEILAKRVMFNIKFSKIPKTLPIFLTKEEVKRLIDSIINSKHKIMIELMYSAGLRVSEVTNLKIEDLDLKNRTGWIRQGKGRKDRIFVLAEKLVSAIANYLIIIRKENGYLFSGRREQISIRSLQEIVKKATKKAKINKKVHCHTLGLTA